MKKVILFMLFMAAFSAASFAQGVSGGIKAGVNFANQTFEGSGITIEPDSRTGFHGGLYVTAMFSEKLGVQPEAFYSMQGSKFSSGGSTLETKIDYISIPVLLRYNLTNFFNLHAGPQFGLVINAEQSLDGATSDIKDQVKSGDFGIAFGAGVDAPMGISGGLRYVIGTSDIDDSGSTSGSAKNKMFQIYVAYRLFGNPKK